MRYWAEFFNFYKISRLLLKKTNLWTRQFLPSTSSSRCGRSLLFNREIAYIACHKIFWHIILHNLSKTIVISLNFSFTINYSHTSQAPHNIFELYLSFPEEKTKKKTQNSNKFLKNNRQFKYFINTVFIIMEAHVISLNIFLRFCVVIFRFSAFLNFLTFHLLKEIGYFFFSFALTKEEKIAFLRDFMTI